MLAGDQAVALPSAEGAPGTALSAPVASAEPHSNGSNAGVEGSGAFHLCSPSYPMRQCKVAAAGDISATFTGGRTGTFADMLAGQTQDINEKLSPGPSVGGEGIPLSPELISL